MFVYKPHWPTTVTKTNRKSHIVVRFAVAGLIAWSCHRSRVADNSRLISHHNFKSVKILETDKFFFFLVSVTIKQTTCSRMSQIIIACYKSQNLQQRNKQHFCRKLQSYLDATYKGTWLCSYKTKKGGSKKSIPYKYCAAC